MIEELETFRQIYLQHFGEELTEEETARKAAKLLNLYVAVYGNPTEVVQEEW